MRNKAILIFFMLCLILSAVLPAIGSDVTISYYYRQEQDPEIPIYRLYVGWVADCGDYSIKFLQQPILTKSNNYLIADGDLQYLVLRVAITNNTDESLGWLSPDSFKLQETYMGRIYGTYSLAIPESAKVSDGFHEQVFYAEIKPKDTLYTSLVFAVYPDVKWWILNFSPHTFGQEAEETVRFRIPFPIQESEVTL